MGIRWLCSSIIIIVIISTSNTQNIANKWKIENKKHTTTSSSSSNNNDDNNNNFVNKKSSNYKKIKFLEVNKNDDDTKDSNYSKQFEKIFEEHERETDEKSSKVHSRKKRLIWVSDDGRLALPPGTVLSISPTLSLPLVRYPPTGFLSNLTLSFPLTSMIKY